MTGLDISEQTAINSALKQDWKEAIRQNSELLKKDKNNTNILNRLGFAYLQIGKFTLAKKTFQTVIALDEYNQIALKNIKKLGIIRQKDIPSQTGQLLSPMLFLEEPGKTKIIECINATNIQTLSGLSPGQEVLLRAKNHAVEVRSLQNVYLAVLPDDVSYRLIKYLAGGNTYKALVKSINKSTLYLFVREMSRGKRFINQPTFATNGYSMPYAKAEIEKDVSGADTEDQDSIND